MRAAMVSAESEDVDVTTIATGEAPGRLSSAAQNEAPRPPRPLFSGAHHDGAARCAWRVPRADGRAVSAGRRSMASPCGCQPRGRVHIIGHTAPNAAAESMDPPCRAVSSCLCCCVRPSLRRVRAEEAEAGRELGRPACRGCRRGGPARLPPPPAAAPAVPVSTSVFHVSLSTPFPRGTG